MVSRIHGFPEFNQAGSPVFRKTLGWTAKGYPLFRAHQSLMQDAMMIADSMKTEDEFLSDTVAYK
jgi:hypothetical protein